MNILAIYLGGPIPEIDAYSHPKQYIESLGVQILEWHGTLMGSSIAVEIDQIPANLPKFIHVLDDWPEWAKYQRQIGVSSDV